MNAFVQSATSVFTDDVPGGNVAGFAYMLSSWRESRRFPRLISFSSFPHQSRSDRFAANVLPIMREMRNGADLQMSGLRL